MRLIQFKLDPSIFYKIDKNDRIFLDIYVDDLILFTNNQELKLK